MAKVLLFICLLLAMAATPQGAGAQSAQQTFDQANQLYQRHVYDSAALLYERLTAAGYDNPELFYNAGNACLKARRLGYAVYYYEKALRQSPGNPVIAHNLALARAEATEKVDQIPTLFFVRWWQQLLHLHRPGGWAAGSIVCFWLLVFFAGWRLVRPPAPRWTKWAVVVTACLFACYLAGAWGSWYGQTHHEDGIVIRADEPVKTAPDASSPQVLSLHEGTKVEITDEVNGWQKVRMPDGKEGWVKASAILPL